ncbi:MAG: hypothetical protein ACPLX7_10105 [Candidatus Kapaibacteriota bacterium]
MAAIEIISGSVTAPGSTLQVTSPVIGDTYQIKNVPTDSKIMLAGIWANTRAAGFISLTSPQLHDTTVGMKMSVTPNNQYPILFGSPNQEMVPNDILTVKLSGSSTSTNVEQLSMLLYYSDFPGINQNLISMEEVNQRIWDIKTTSITITPTASNTYSGTKTLNADENIFNAKREYALIGYTITGNCTSIALRGPDTSNTRIGMPGISKAYDLTPKFFIHLSEKLGVPCIPLINPENRSATFVEILQNETLTPVTIDFIFAALVIE